ncbi:MAG TPA: glycolate oxidase subunit GlcF [Gammaproteobacteria bacterium]|jgi:glycolate oxidase iron-sulfur subunit
MRTEFTAEQLEDPALRESEAIIRRCVHCGFCNATCPTYLLQGDELDSPRGRIYLIKEMLENDRPATTDVVRHVDRCLSCLACMTTCPSGVNYQHLVDHARAHIEQTYRRPWSDRWMRAFLAAVMPYPRRFAFFLVLGRLARPFAPLLPRRLSSALALLSQAAQPGSEDGGVGHVQPNASAAAVPAPATNARVGVLTGCVQSVLGSSANAATFRLLSRMGAEPVELSGCCGSLSHHLGRSGETRDFAVTVIERLKKVESSSPVDAIAVTASGCGVHLNDYGFVFREDDQLAESAARVSELARDVTEVVAELGLPTVTRPGGLRVAYHSACSMQHGLRNQNPPRELLRAAGFEVVEIPEGHVCCGSAGTYNMLQPELADRLRERKLGHLAGLDFDVIAAGNLGCMTQLAAGTDRPIVHTVELLDWATGGPVPSAIAALVAA